MTFTRYPAYVASSEDWIRELPAHWSSPPLYSRYEVLLGKMLDEKRQTGTVPLPYVRNVNVQWDQVDVTDLPQMDVALGERERFTLRPGDLLVYEGGDIGRTATWTGQLEVCAFQKALHRLRPSSENENPRFLFYTMRAASDTGVFLARGNPNTIPHLTGEALRVYRFPKPARDEQDAIVEFLDRETAKIDELVEEQRRLIALLDEKRQAVISHAVTKGLNPDAPMKRSGDDWLGDVPEHWEVTPLMRLTDSSRPIMYGIVLPGPDVGEGVPILKGGNVRPARMNLDAMARTTPELEAPYARARLKGGDIVYSIRGTIGDCEIVPDALAGANITQDVARVSTREGVYPSWLRWALLGAAVREGLACGSLGAAVRGINIFDLKRARVPCPPIEEQIEIAAYVSKASNDIEALCQEGARCITLLLERRSALITAAVTGQIDVRALAPTEAP